ncbi:hypothetical protein [Flavobacterium sp. YO12]|uniref:Bacteriocin n=1 Tax=Flavobacterium oncorhynchi TaxID=728056 RepID=A0A226I5T7_9FLAO|nr:hypothetical protein [Flavobacterium sp. YO12]OXB01467.1 hypothetical protein B0A75_07880 [Flavobacterium oncorhynchi]RXM49380.1 hypothetical protein BOW55_00890 [Flavobacterium sp. YO12]
MLKKILNLKHAQHISKNEQKTIKGGIPECWVYAIEAGCVLIPSGGTCPINMEAGICDTNRLCC